MEEKSEQGLSRPKRRLGWKAFAKRAALLAGSLTMVIVCLEVALRLFSDTAPALTEKDPVIGQRYIRSFNGDVFIPEAGHNVALRFNDVGFRGCSRSREKPPGVCRVAVLGDSMIASLAVDEEKTMVCQLERMLNQSHPETKWQVLNFGVNGASPGQEMVLYRELVSQFQPDVVLCTFFVGNDLADNCSRLSRNPRIYFDVDGNGNLQQQPFSGRRAAVSLFFNRYSRAYVWQRTALNKARHTICQQLGALEPGMWVFSKTESPDVAHAWKITGTIFQEFRREVESHGSRFAVVMIPYAAQVYKNEFTAIATRAADLVGEFDPEHPDRRVAEMCGEAGIPFFSMLEDFRKAAPSASSQVSEEWLFCNGTGHFNEQGDRLAARAIHRFLTEGEPHQVADRPLVGTMRY